MARVIVFYAIPEFVKERLNNVCVSDFCDFSIPHALFDI